MGSKLSSRCVRLGTICSADKEKDSTYSEVIHIVAWVETGPGTGVGTAGKKNLRTEPGSDP